MNCYFCQKGVREIDFKNVEPLKRFISATGKIKPRKKTGLCRLHQKKIAKAIKKARLLGLISFFGK
jgi:small subunit ribosomal protein S18